MTEAAPTTQAEQEDAVHRHTWIGDDCPEGWRRVGSIDVADPADIVTARDKGRRIGEIYDGGSYSVAEPCCADTYARTPLGERADELEWKVGDLQEDLKFAEAQRDQLAAELRKAWEAVDRLRDELSRRPPPYSPTFTCPKCSAERGWFPACMQDGCPLLGLEGEEITHVE